MTCAEQFGLRIAWFEGKKGLGVRADAESLRQIPLFRNCEAVPLQVMAFAGERRAFRPGETVIRQGANAEAAYFILSGTADIHQGGDKLGEAHPGAFLGESAMLAGSVYTITATASDELSAVRIDNALFKRVASEYPEFGRAVLDALSERLGNSVKELETIRQMLSRTKGFSQL
jgi:CRP/FNR family transcriptional regulator, cyclic AMP receptor protein